MRAAAQVWLVGTAADCDIIVREPGIDLRHCIIILANGTWYVDDLNSPAGTFLDGRRLRTRAVWSDGESLLLAGRFSLIRPRKPPSVTRLLLTIGHDVHNDVVLRERSVAKRHAIFRVTAADTMVEDLRSPGGTYVNGRMASGSSKQIQVSDVLRFGEFELAAAELFHYLADRQHPFVTIHLGSKPSIKLGSSNACDLRISWPGVAEEHARITPGAQGYLIEDLRTVKGTFVNRKRIGRRTRIVAGDLVTLGDYDFIVLTGDGEAQQIDNPVGVSAVDVCVEVPQKRLLSNVSFTLCPGELTGLMGLSGAGKSTLISTLNGYVAPTSGAILMNGRNLHQYFPLFRESIGFVPQDDIVHDNLTVGLALFYSARLRLPTSTTDAEVRQRVESVARELGLAEAMDVLIGSSVKKGISGGQRKRVNLAMELITDPPVLLLDEPTSGLSSEDALNVMTLLRKFANEGRNVLITIHQPGAEVFQLLDNVIVLASQPANPLGGRMVYFGPAYPDSIDFFNPSSAELSLASSPDEVLRGAARESVDAWVNRYNKSPYVRKFVEDRAAKHFQGQTAAIPSSTPPWIKHFKDCFTLLNRCTAVKIRDRWNTAILVLQAPIIGCLIAAAFGKRARAEMTFEGWHDAAKATTSVVFLFVLTAIWFGCSNAAREIVGEWAIYVRERMVNLAVLPYLISKMVVLTALCVGQCAALLLIGYWACGLKCPWYVAFGVLLISACCGIGLGLMVSAVSRSSEMAIACLPLVILPMVILCGVLQPLKEMNAATRAVAQLMPSRWAFEALLLAEASHRPKWSLPVAAIEASKPSQHLGVARIEDLRPQELVLEVDERDLAESHFPLVTHRMGLLPSCIVLVVMALLYFLATALILIARDIR